MTHPAQSLPDATRPDPSQALSLPTPGDLEASMAGWEVEPPPTGRRLSSPAAFLAVAGVAALVVILCVLGAAMMSFGIKDSGTADQPSVAPAQGQPATNFADGQWLVGTDIQPGTYQVTVDAGSPGCSWERNASTDGTPDSVIEAGGGTEGQQLEVTVLASDQIFQSRHCGNWSRTGD